MKNPTENNEASHNYVKGANIGGIHAEIFTLYFIGNNNTFIRFGSIESGSNNTGNTSISVAAPTPKYSILTDSFEKLTFSQRAKVLSLIAKLLKEQENQP